MLKLIMALARRSKLAYIHPLEKACLAIIPIIIMGFVKNPIIVIINILVFIILHIKTNNNLEVVRKFSLEIALFSAFSSITFVLDYGWSFVLVIILRSISAGLCLSFFSLTTPIDQIFYVLSKRKSLRDICDIAKSMERFLVVINEEYNIMYNSMKSRGGFDSFSLKIKSTGKLAALLFVNTMERWKNIKEGIYSRGYRGYMPYIYKEFHFSMPRFMFVMIYDLILITLAFYFK
ncbi:cobalt/nickel transport system permease protein [Clostridium pascui]|uniref:cobalt ECF transporter T component CbiQ n=1 Tax=Clostridium pascui TaxID=46609 RepID=UPI001FAFC60E|nr:cobalt ECF transporter T component CbiQ [Clostridium pascui]MBM7870838.1 cobalt/nickel transport system permease protein [Clostridium pascui]